MNISSAERARLQTVEEWLLEYKTGKPVMPSILTKKQSWPQSVNVVLRYESHRTTKFSRLITKSSRLILAFIDVETGQEVNAFFNADIIRKRGKHKGTTYRTGLGGQFNVTSRHKFYKFWMDIVGEEPTRWCRVHKEMKSKLGKLIFTGELSTGHREDGSPFMQVRNIKKLDTTMAHHRHNLDTTKTQLQCTTS